MELSETMCGGLEDGSLERLFQIGDLVAGVAPKDLVASLASEHNLHMPRCETGDDVLGQESGPGGGLIHVVDEPGEELHQMLGRAHHFVTLRPIQGGDLSRVGGFVELRPLSKRSGKRLECVSGL